MQRRGRWGRRARRLGQPAWLQLVLERRRWRAAVLLLLLFGAAVVVARRADRRHRQYVTWSALWELRRAAQRFRLEVGRCPRSAGELLHPPAPVSLELRALPRDGWGRPLWFRCPSLLWPQDVDVVSAGPSGRWDLEDNLQ